tara:strand:+ start:99 stop:314 length:216 start_codon:yes stop_codon:yes gene_type:complete
MKYVPPKKLKVLMIMFFAAAGFGIFTGLVVSSGMQGLIITFLGVVNLCLGGFMGYLLLLQKPKVRDSRKRD